MIPMGAFGVDTSHFDNCLSHIMEKVHLLCFGKGCLHYTLLNAVLAFEDLYGFERKNRRVWSRHFNLRP